MVLFGDTLELTEEQQNQDQAAPCCVFAVPDSPLLTLALLCWHSAASLCLSPCTNVCVCTCLLNGLMVTKVMPLCWLQRGSPKNKSAFIFNPSRVITVRSFSLDAVLFLNLGTVFHLASHLSHRVHSHFLSHQEAWNVGLSHYRWCEVCHWIEVGFLRFLHCSVNFSTLVIKKKKRYFCGEMLWCFPSGSDGKASVCSAGHPGLIPGLGRSPGEGNGSLLQYSCLENPVDCGVHGAAKSRTRLSDFTFTFTFHFEAILFLSKLQSQDSGCTDGSSLNQSPCAGCCLTVPSPHLPSLLPYFFPFSCKESSTFSPLLTCSFLIVSLWTQMS